MNILALLDSAIAELAHETTSRTSRDCESENPLTGTEKASDSAKLPVLPVNNAGTTGIGLDSRYGDMQTAS